MIKKLLLVGLCIGVIASQAQKRSFTHFSVEDGLQNNIVFACTQDQKGFMWFGTMTGIDRFDGNSFVHYKLPAPKTGNPEFAQVSFIFLGKQQEIWAASPWSLYKYNQRMDRFEAVELVANTVAENQTSISQVIQDGNGNIWVGMNSGFFVYQPQQDRVIQPDNFRNYTRNMFAVGPQAVWLAMNRGLAYFELEDSTLKRGDLGKIFNGEDLSNEQISSISKDGNNRVWLGLLGQGLKVFSPWESKPQTIKLPGTTSGNYQVKSVFHEKETGLHYVASDGGGIVLINDALKIESIQETNEDDPNSLSNNGVYQVFKDRFGRIWVTTYGGGVNLLATVALPFKNFQHEINNPNSLSNNMAKAVTEDRMGRIWFGTRRGLSVYDPKTQGWFQINKETGPADFTADNILALQTDTDGMIWVGSYGGGLMKIDPNTRAVKSYTKNDSIPGTIGTNQLFALTVDQYKQVWTGGIRGPISVLDQNTGLFKKSPLTMGMVNCLQTLSDGSVWAGTDRGLYRLDPVTLEGTLVSLLDDKDENVRMKVFAIMEYQPGEIWVGAQGYGVFRYNINNSVTDRITSSKGLPTDNICSIIKDNNGDVWISTITGIAHYQVKRNRMTSYTRADGLAGSQFNPGAGYNTSDGKLIFGSTNGFSLFDPGQIKVTATRAPIHFTGLTVNNKPIVPAEENAVLPAQLDELTTLELAYNQNNLTIDFVSPVPAWSGRHLYSWKLEGFDKNWSPPGIISTATYTNLNSGTYTLLVKAIAKGQQSDAADVRELKIHIRAPWWASGWAYLIYILLLAGLAYATYNFVRIRAARRRFAERLKLNTSISHEIRTPLTLIKGPVSALVDSVALPEEDRQNLALAKKNIAKLEQIIGQFIDYQKSGTTKLQLQVEQGDLVELLDEVFASFVPLMKAKHLAFAKSLPEERTALLFDRDKMEKVFNNLISNAVKYTPEGNTVSITARETARHLLIQVSDTGIGIPENQQHLLFKGYFRAQNAMNLKETGSGVGLSVTRELVELHKGQLSFESEQDRGTSFTVKLPLHNEALLPYLAKAPGDSHIPGEYQVEKAVRNAPSNGRIVIAEDNDELRRYMEVQMAQAGYSVAALTNGKLALTHVQKYGADLVITDVMMPEMNGFQLCTALKKEINTCHIPVIMLTAIHDREYLLEGYRSGADDFVRKPFDLAYIFARIENLLQNRTRFKTKILSVFEQEEAVVENDSDLTWLKEATTLIADHISDPEFSVEKLARLLAMSRPVLFRKFKSITSENPQTYINQIRLRKAVELLQMGKHPISDIAYMTGFSDPKYFSTAFKKHFGKSPSEYARSGPGAAQPVEGA